MKARRVLCGVLIAGIIVFSVIAIACIRDEREFNFGVVTPGVLMRCAQPNAHDLVRIARRYDLKTIINLRGSGSEHIIADPAVAEEMEFARAHDIQLLYIPVTTPPSEEHIRQFLDILDDPANHPVLVHCAQGQARTGMLCAAYGMERLGWSNAEALAQQAPFKFFRCPNVEELKAFVLGYQPKGRGADVVSGQ